MFGSPDTFSPCIGFKFQRHAIDVEVGGEGALNQDFSGVYAVVHANNHKAGGRGGGVNFLSFTKTGRYLFSVFCAVVSSNGEYEIDASN